jgi:hypothetical protein
MVIFIWCARKFVIILIESSGMAEESVRHSGRQTDRQAGPF